MQAIVLSLYALVVAVSFGLHFLNFRHLRRAGHEVPPELQGSVDEALLSRMAAYTEDRARFGLVTRLLSSAALLVFVLVLLEPYDRFVGSITEGFVPRAVLFFVGLTWIESVLGIPLGLYAAFRIEARHGFNRMTKGLWWGDWIKGLLVSSVLLVLLVGFAAWLVQASPERWWLLVWALLIGFSVLLLYLSPVLIEPLFFKLEPLESGLAEEVRALAERAGVHVSRVFTMDASRRSAHSNAYFTGIGRTKRVVLFDTLLTQLTPSQILGVLAHELGHWRKRHVQKRLLSMAVVALGACYLAHWLIEWRGLPGLVGAGEVSFPARVVILGFVGSIVSFAFTPLSAWWSRRHEWEADRFASELSGAPGDLADALVKLSRENLANLHPHPWYAKFYYSHPHVTERVRSLRAAKAIEPRPA